jgi:hypothetical protein
MKNATFESAGTLENPNLFAGSFPRVTRKVTIVQNAGANLDDYTPGLVLGRVTASGSYAPVDDSLATGAENPRAVLAHSVDPTGGDVEAIVYLTGDFNRNELKFGGDDTAADHEDALRDLSIFIHNTNVGA